MKLKLITSLVALIILPASAVTINVFSGAYRDSTGSAVADGTLFALIADTDANGFFGGSSSFGVDSSLTTTQANSLFTPGQTLTKGGLLGGDSVFWVGTVNGSALGDGAGIVDIVAAFTLSTATSGLNYSLLWFPGGTLDGARTVGTIGNQAGGLNTLITGGGNTAMTVPTNNAASVNQGALDTSNGSGLAISRFNAVNLVPEPSAAILGALGALCLLHRRRN